MRGRKLQFTNVEQETPIGELGAYYVSAGKEPAGVGRLTYRVTSAVEPNQASVVPIVRYINGRYEPDERAIDGGGAGCRASVSTTSAARELPARAADRPHRHPVGLP